MDEERRRLLARRAMSEFSSSIEMLLVVQSIDELAAEDVPVPIDLVREQLLKVMRSPWLTYQAGRAQRMAGKLLAMIDGQPDLVWAHPEPLDTVEPGYWPWDRDPPAADQLADQEELFLCDTYFQRDKWHAAEAGHPAPWRR